MSYHIYTTQGIVLRHWPLREADRVYSILTRDLGLVRASATGVRKEESKLRSSLEPFSLSLVSLVKGKEYWRITSARLEQRLSPELAQPFSLLEKLIRGEDSNPELFDTITEFLGDTMIYHSVGEKELLEIKLVSRILYHLGYMDKGDLELDNKDLIKAINAGLKASGLA